MDKPKTPMDKFLSDIQYFAEESVKSPGPNGAVTSRMVTMLYERQRKPGSQAARDSGCTCPVIDNCYGRGYRNDGARYGWIQVEGCPVHDRCK